MFELFVNKDGYVQSRPIKYQELKYKYVKNKLEKDDGFLDTDGGLSKFLQDEADGIYRQPERE